MGCPKYFNPKKKEVVKIKKKKIILPIVLILLVALIGLALYKGVIETALGECRGGANYIITDADVYSSGDLGGKQVIRLIATASKSGECVLINFDKNILNEKLKDDGYAVLNSGVMDIKLEPQEQTFKFEPSSGNPSQPYYTISEKNIGKITACSDIFSSCSDAGLNYPINSYREGFFDLDCLCLNHDTIYGLNGEFSSQYSSYFTAKISVSGVGEEKVSTSKGSAVIGNKVSIKWNVDMLGGEELTKPSYSGIYRNGQWKIVESGTYQEMLSRLETAKNCADYKNRDISRGCMDTYNTYLEDKTSSKLIQYVNSNPIIETANIDGNSLKVRLNRPTRLPQFIIDLDAQWVGIYKLSGEPKVTCPSTVELKSGESTPFSFNIQNIGQEPAVFGISLTCNNIPQYTAREEFSKGQSRTFSATLTGTNLEKDTVDTQKCSLSAYDINLPTLKDGCTFDMEVEAVIGDCNLLPIKDLCEENNLLKCQSSGEYKIIKCPLGCEYKDGKAQCRQIGKEICNNGLDDDNDGLIDLKDPDCQIISGCNPIKLGAFTIFPDFKEECFGLLNGISFFVAIIIFLISWVLLGLTLSDFMLGTKTFARKKQLNALGITIAIFIPLIISIILYILILKLLIWGIVIGIAYLVLLGLVKALRKKFKVL